MKFKKILVVVLAMISVVALSILPASAASCKITLEELKSIYDIDYDTSKYPYYVLYSAPSSRDSEYYLVCSSSKSAFELTDNSIYIRSNSYWFDCFKIDDKCICNSNSIGSGPFCYYGAVSGVVIYDSNYDIYNLSTNEVFFHQPTLLQSLLNLVPGQLGSRVVSDLTTLTVCGIGCLALLICLALLPKVLYKFL